MGNNSVSPANLRAVLGREIDLILLPGEVHLAQTPALVSTLLGSCVSLVLYSPRLRICAISHAQLPEDKSSRQCSDLCPVRCLAETQAGNRNRFVTCSTQNMLQSLARLGVAKEELEVKLFGGANVLSCYSSTTAIGTQNVEMAHRIIEQLRLKLVSEDTGGESGRTIYCYTGSNKVLVRRHAKKESDQSRPAAAAGGGTEGGGQ